MCHLFYAINRCGMRNENLAHSTIPINLMCDMKINTTHMKFICIEQVPFILLQTFRV